MRIAIFLLFPCMRPITWMAGTSPAMTLRPGPDFFDNASFREQQQTPSARLARLSRSQASRPSATFARFSTPRGRRSIHPERGQIEIKDRLLLDPFVAVLLSDRYDLSQDPDVEAVRLGFAVDILDVAGQRLLLLFEALDPFDESPQVTGVDLACCPGLGDLVCFRQ